MKFEIFLTKIFRKQAKRLIKKYHSLKKELADLRSLLSENPNQGIALANGVFKIRLAVASKNKGKSGGLRIIYYVITKDYQVFLAAIYDKSEYATLTDEEIKQALAEIPRQ